MGHEALVSIAYDLQQWHPQRPQNPTPETERKSSHQRDSGRQCLVEFAAEGLVSPKEGEVASLVEQFAEAVSEMFRQRFIDLLQQDCDQGGRVSQAIIDHIAQNNLAIPSFTIVTGRAKEQKLWELGIETDKCLKDKVILVFRMPKPLEVYYWKFGRFLGPSNEGFSDAVIEWGHFCNETKELVWDAIYQDFHKELKFWKLNHRREHTINGYYYVWLVNARPANSSVRY